VLCPVGAVMRLKLRAVRADLDRRCLHIATSRTDSRRRRGSALLRWTRRWNARAWLGARRICDRCRCIGGCCPRWLPVALMSGASRRSGLVRACLLLAGALAASATLAGSASAQSSSPVLPEGETAAQAASDVAAGTETGTEAEVTAGDLYAVLVGAGVSTATAEAYVIANLPNGALSLPGAAGWEAYGAAVASGEATAGAAVAGDVAAEGVAAAADTGVIAGGLSAVGAALTDAAVATAAGAAVATAGLGVAIGTGIDYLLGDFSSSDPSVPAGDGNDWDAEAVRRGWAPKPTTGGAACPSGHGSTGYWNVGEDSSAITSGGGNSDMEGLVFSPVMQVPCSEAGVFELQYQQNVATPAVSANGWVEAWDYSVAGNCDQLAADGPDPGTPAATGGTANSPTAGYYLYPWTAIAQHGWTWLKSPALASCGGSTTGSYAAARAIEPFSAVKLSAPKTSCPSGDTCTPIADNPSTSWTLNPSTLATELGGPQSAGLNQYFTSQAGGTTSSGSPVLEPGTIPIPSCAGDSYGVCTSTLTGDGFTGTLTEVTLPGTSQVNSDGAGNVVTTSPTPGTTVDPSLPLTIDVNPNPLWVDLPAPASGETASAYQSQLAADGVTGTITITQVSDENESATAGPDGVVGVEATSTGASVATGTLVSPTAPLTILENPVDAPAAGTVATPSAGAACGLTPPSASANFTPITNANLGEVFPFSVIPWISNLFGSAPSTEEPPLTLSVFGTSIDVWSPLGSTFDPVFAAIRLALEVCLWVGAMWLLYRRVLGWGE
jgi:hypothetical protein